MQMMMAIAMGIQIRIGDINDNSEEDDKQKLVNSDGIML